MCPTYCGKSCEYCEWKETLHCEGCQEDSEQLACSDCELANCCQNRQHAHCTDCPEREYCTDLEKRDEIPQQRLERRQMELQLHQKTAQNAPKLALLLGILFWLVIPRSIAVVLGQEALTSRLPMLGTLGSVLGSICNLAYAIVLLKLTFTSGKYRRAAMCALTSWALNAIMLFMNASIVTTVLVLVAMAITLVADYFEFHAHAELLDPLNMAQAETFRLLWKWNIAAMGSLAIGMVLLTFSPFFGIVLVLTGASGSVIVMVRKLICLNRAWRLFRDYE